MGQHTFDGMLNYPRWLSLHHFLKSDGLQSSGISGMTVISLLLCFVAGNPDLVRIDDDDVISGIQIGAKHRLMLAHQ